MPKKIKFIKSCDGGKIGEIKNYSKSSADSLVEEGYAEYITKSDSPQEMKVSKNTEKDTNNSDVSLLVMLGNNQQRGKEETLNNDNSSKLLVNAKTNITNITNKTNITNITNKTSILDIPEKSVDKIYYFLYDNKESTAQQVVDSGACSSVNVFWNQKGRDKDIEISRKEGKIAFYSISKSKYDEIEFKINQKIESQKLIEQNKKELKEKDAQKSKTDDELLQKFGNIIMDKSISSFVDGYVFINMKELKEIETEVFDLLIERPQQTIQLFEIAIKEKSLGEDVRVRFSNLESVNKTNIENYRTKHLGKLICSEAKITSMSKVRSLIVNAKFECPSCGTIISVLQIDKRFKEPSRCSCGRRGGFQELSKDMIDTSTLKAEDIESKSDVPIGKDVICLVKDNLLKRGEIEKIIPGSNLRILGVLKEILLTSNSGHQLTQSDWALNIIDIEEFDPDLNSIDFTEEEIKEFKILSSRISVDGLSTLTSSYAPEVEGYEIEKKALMIQGSQKKNTKDTDNTKSHIAIFGDPGVSKSVLAKFTQKVTQGSTYSSGSGSSGVGLTASVIKEDGIGWVMKPGQLPLTRELAVLDEFNLITDEDKPKLQEAMSEGKISIHKAGISASPGVTCGVLALANPIRGIFDKSQSLVKQFNLLPQQLNRFDAMFIQMDNRDPEQDEKIADIMLKRKSGKIECEFDYKFLRKFFTYVRSIDEPMMNDESKTALKKAYKLARNLTRNNSTILLNPRFLDSLTRLSTGHAKLRGAKTISQKDVDEAYEIVSCSYLNLKNYTN
jgi:DNA replicative helicase MCM subunit Mcm2 (Cdc46/Mcm family)